MRDFHFHAVAAVGPWRVTTFQSSWTLRISHSILRAQTSLSPRTIYSSETTPCWQPSKRAPRIVRRAVSRSQMGIPTIIDKERGRISINEQGCDQPCSFAAILPRNFASECVVSSYVFAAGLQLVTLGYAPSPPLSPLAIPLTPRGRIAWILCCTCLGLRPHITSATTSDEGCMRPQI